MKQLVIMILCIALCLSPWFIYSDYSAKEFDINKKALEEKLLPYTTSENWDYAEAALDEFSESWHKYKRIASFFVDRELLTDIDYSIARSKYFIKAEDVSNASGELAAIIEQLRFLRSSEQVFKNN